MLNGKLIHPQIMSALALCGHGDKILIADGNYPLASKTQGAQTVYLGLKPGQPTVTDVLDAILSAANVEKAEVISGTVEGVSAACALAKEEGAKRALPLKVGGAFHSPLMEPARAELAEAIQHTEFHTPKCPVYQNVDGLPHTDPEDIKRNLVAQLTSSVRWTQSVLRMVEDGADEFVECGPGSVLQGLVKKIAPEANAHAAM